MNFSDNRGIKTQQWFSGEVLHFEDINLLGTQSYQNLTDLLATMLPYHYGDQVVSGLEVELTSGLNAELKPGAAVSFSGSYLTGDSWGFVASEGSAFSVIVPSIQILAFNSTSGSDRIDIVQIRPVQNETNEQVRQFKDPITGSVSSALTNTTIDYSFEVQIVEGIEASVATAPATTSGWIKVAEVTVNGSTITTARNVEDSMSWNTKVGRTHQGGVRIKTTGLSVTTGFAILGIGPPALTGLTSELVAFVDSTTETLQVIGTAASTVVTGIGTPEIAALSSTDIALAGSSIDELRMYRYDNSGGTITQIGASLSVSGMGGPAMCALSSTDIAFCDSDRETLERYRFDGSTWSLVGSGLTLTGLGFPSLTALSETRVVMTDNVRDDIAVYDWTGTTWSLVTQQSLNESINIPAIEAISRDTVIITDSTTDALRLMRYRNGLWEDLLQVPFSVVSMGNPAMAYKDFGEVWFIDDSNETLDVIEVEHKFVIPSYRPHLS